MDVLKDVPFEGKRLIASRVLSNGSMMKSPSVAFLILAHLERHVIVTGGETTTYPLSESVTEWAEENCTGRYFAADLFTGGETIKRLFAFENDIDAMMFKLRYDG